MKTFLLLDFFGKIEFFLEFPFKRGKCFPEVIYLSFLLEFYIVLTTNSIFN